MKRSVWIVLSVSLWCMILGSSPRARARHLAVLHAMPQRTASTGGMAMYTHNVE